MHILPEILRYDARRMSQYASASLLKSRTNCAIVGNPFTGCKFVGKVTV